MLVSIEYNLAQLVTASGIYQAAERSESNRDRQDVERGLIYFRFLGSCMCVLQSKTLLKGVGDKACSLVMKDTERKTLMNELLRIPKGADGRRKPMSLVGVPRSFHAYSHAFIGLLVVFYWSMSLILMDPTQIDQHASYHSPLHPLKSIMSYLISTSLSLPKVRDQNDIQQLRTSSDGNTCINQRFKNVGRKIPSSHFRQLFRLEPMALEKKTISIAYLSYKKSP